MCTHVEQVRVVGVVRRAVGHRAVHAVVDRADDVDRLLGVLGGAERGDREVAAGPGEPAPHVAAVARVLGDRGHRLRLHRLEQHRPDARRRTSTRRRARRVIGLPGGNQRGPGVPWMRSRCVGAVRPGHAQEQRPAESLADAHPAERTGGGSASQVSSPTSRSTSGSRNGCAEELLDPGERPGPRLGVARGEPHRQMAVADVVQLGDGHREVGPTGDPPRVRRPRGRRRTAGAGERRRPARARTAASRSRARGRPGRRCRSR